MRQNSEFDFEVDDSRINRSLYETGSGVSYASIAYHGKSGSPLAGSFTLERDSADFPPGSYWNEERVRFGSDPNGVLETVWRTELLRGCILGVRKRFSVTTDSGEVLHYPWLTPAKNRESGKFAAHFQIALVTPEFPELVFVLGLRGYSKTQAWGNPARGKFHNKNFPPGVETLLSEYVATARKVTGKYIPELCSFWVDLVPHRKPDNSLGFVNVGHGTYMVPFTVDLQKPENLPRRFVGMELLQKFGEIRERELIDWENEWKKPSSAESGVDPYDETEESSEEELRRAFGEPAF